MWTIISGACITFEKGPVVVGCHVSVFHQDAVGIGRRCADCAHWSDTEMKIAFSISIHQTTAHRARFALKWSEVELRAAASSFETDTPSVDGRLRRCRPNRSDSRDQIKSWNCTVSPLSTILPSTRIELNGGGRQQTTECLFTCQIGQGSR